MFVHLFADRLSREISGAVLTGDALPDWGIKMPQYDVPRPKMLVQGHQPNLIAIRQFVQDGLVRGVETSALACRMELLPSLDVARGLFPLRGLDVPHFGDDDLVINVRLMQANDTTHGGMPPAPVAFYEHLVRETGRRPVFMGQIGNDRYSEVLRSRFPQAKFVSSLGAMADFEMLRRARHVVCAASSFSWLATWLSHADTIHLPMIGFMHPRARKDINLLPFDDRRYRFYDFAPAVWKASEEEWQLVMHGGEEGKPVTDRDVASLLHGIRW